MALLTHTDIGAIDADMGFLGIAAWGAEKVVDKLRGKKKKKKKKAAAPVAAAPVVAAAPAPPPKPTLSTGAKVGIGVGVLALLVGAYMLLRKKKKAA